MLRKLIALALVGAGIAAVVIKRRGGGGSAPTSASEQETPATGYAPQADAPQAAEEKSTADDLAEVRSGQTEATIEAPIAGAGGDEQAVIPDVSDDDPLVREAEAGAAAAAGSIGGEADSVTADVDPEMRPVYEGSGSEPETFETTEEQGR